MTNSDKAKELQKCVKTILRYCESKKIVVKIVYSIKTDMDV